ncbi:Mediator of RNA polymerase II transcription subunit 17 [Orobanche gracilis]
MDGDLEISLDQLPIKRLESIEENGVERFPSDLGYDEKRVNLIRRVDFDWAVEREDPSKKRKAEGTSAKEGGTTNQQQWQWKSLVENLQLAHQELSVIIDLINTDSSWEVESFQLLDRRTRGFAPCASGGRRPLCLV